ncbi:MAG: hypothetical protein K9N06_00665 [Candidatus Cloacimonetes bacterium]|nr:hypothetical protein [Candidatus Cloacimonadota bacterium]
MKTAYLLIIVLILLLTGCAAQEREIVIEEPESRTRIMEIPAWFLELPAGDYVIGISKLSFMNLEMEMAAFQNAVVSYCRNHSSYIVNNQAIRESEILMASGEARFRVIVSSEPQMLQAASEKLVKLDSFWFYDNYIGLYGWADAAFDKRRLGIEIIEEPDAAEPEWYSAELRRNEDKLTAAAAGISFDAISAWAKAQDAVRIRLAEYLETDVSGSVYHINEMEDRLITLETTKRMGAMNLKRCYMRRYLGSGGPGYTVYLQMEMQL